MAQSAYSSKSSDTEQRNRFAELSSSLAEMAALEGVKIIPFNDPALPYFFATTFDQREHVLNVLSRTVDLAAEVQKRGEKIKDSGPLIWAFCRAWKYTPVSGFFDKLEEGNLVDVYNEHGQLIFANLRFYSIVPYSLEELYFRPWHELFLHQPADCFEKLKSICESILKGPHQLYDLRHLGQHSVNLLSGKRLGVFQPTYFSSLVQSGKVRGFICINQVIEAATTGEPWG